MGVRKERELAAIWFLFLGPCVSSLLCNATHTGGREDNRRERSEREGGSSGGSRGSWLRPHIRVRIVDKDLKGGKYYLKKGRVLDVIGRGLCSVQVLPLPDPCHLFACPFAPSLSLSKV